MLSGGHPVLFDLRFFSVVLLFDERVSCALFLFCGLPCGGDLCCVVTGAVGYAVSQYLLEAGSHRLGDLLVVVQAAFIGEATRTTKVAYATLQTAVLGTFPLTIWVQCLAKKGDIYQAMPSPFVSVALPVCRLAVEGVKGWDN